MEMIFLDFYCPDRSLRSVHVGAVVHDGTVAALEFLEHLSQFIQGFSLQSLPQFIILRHR